MNILSIGCLRGSLGPLGALGATGRLVRGAWLAAGLALLGACTSVQREGQALIERGDYREGLARLEQASRERPGDVELRMQHIRARDQVILRLLSQAGNEAAAGQFDAAAALLRQVQGLDPVNARASAGLAAIDAARRHQVLAEDARAKLARGDLASAELMAKAVLAENPGHGLAREVERELRERERAKAMAAPALRSRLQAPVNLEFREAPLRQVLEALSRSAGVNFILDREVRSDLKATLFVKGVRVEDAIDLVLLNNQLEKKILTDNTLLIYPSTPAKLREHQELVMRTFYLGNADARVTLNLLRTMIKTREMFVDERTNLLVIRDTPDAVRAAERLIAAQDLADPEVVLELEILEVSRSKVRDLGITYPSEFSGPSGTLSQIDNLRRSNIGVDTGFKLKLLRTDGETKTLANPRVRVRHREKARVHIGDRVPVISSTIVGTTASGTGGTSSVPVTTEQIQYIDVGIKVEAEPTIYPDDTVAVKINLDVSSLGTQIKTNAGTTAYEVGTRNAATVLRLRDGETQALMGLIRDDDVVSRSGLPLVGEAPVLDHLFGSRRTDQRSRELVLLITPQLVRGFRPAEGTSSEFWSGTEGALRLRSPFVQTVAEADPRPPALGTEPAPAAAQAGTTAPGPNQAIVGAAGVPSAASAMAATPPPNAAAPSGATSATISEASTATPAAATALPPVAPLTLTWKPPPALRAGQETIVELHARSEAALKGASVQLRFDPAQLEVLAVEEGSFFRQGGRTVFTPRIDMGLGIVFATIGAADAPARGDGRLLGLKLRPRAGAAGKLQLQMSSAVGIDAAGRRVPLQGVVALELGVAP